MRLAQSLFLSAAFLVSAGAGTGADAQSLLERPPNVSGNWTGSPGTLYFHFVHRFSTSDAPERKVSNVPTFLVATGLPKRILVGFNYSTNSTVAPRFPNEWELFARWAPLSQDFGAPLDLGGQVGYNNAADGVDGELSVARKLGITRVILAGRALSDPLESGKVRYAIAGGAAIRLGTYLSLAGDVASLSERDSTERVAWSAGLHLAIPLTPHTLSLQATNSPVATLQGNSRGTANVRYGFEFTIPLTLRRYFGGRSEPSPTGDTVATADPVAPSDAVPTPAVVADTAAPTPVTRPPGRVVTPTPPVARPDTATPRAPAPAPRTTTPARTPPPRTTPAPPASPGG
ncbi:MAG: hypothetical protein H0T48_14600, partial [Gemmatimonadaceae bacterium]|nr:hypothetical protein [Gemmatimonadaceae bacterium]